jgi:hypothetical protein
MEMRKKMDTDRAITTTKGGTSSAAKAGSMVNKDGMKGAQPSRVEQLYDRPT